MLIILKAALPIPFFSRHNSSIENTQRHLNQSIVLSTLHQDDQPPNRQSQIGTKEGSQVEQGGSVQAHQERRPLPSLLRQAPTRKQGHISIDHLSSIIYALYFSILSPIFLYPYNPNCPPFRIFIYYYLRQNMQEAFLKTRPPYHSLHPPPPTRLPHPTLQSTRTQNIKTVEIFMNNLDRQISDSYRKLKKNRDKMSAKKQQSTYIEDTLPHAHSATLQGGPAGPGEESNYYVTINCSPQKHPLPDHQQIVLLENKDVMEYIYLVYDRYNIKDPMADEERPGGIEEGETDKYMTNKKIRKFKDKFQREIGSASTMKNSELYKSVQLNPFPEMKKTILKKQPPYPPTTSGAKIEVVSLISRQHQSRDTSHQKPREQPSIPSSFRLKNQNVITKKQKINITAFKRQEEVLKPPLGSVPQLFRFCFMCEQPILECNLALHEKTCQSLKQALQYNYDDILRILEEKIQRLIGEIQHQLLEKTQEKIKEEFRSIKSSVKHWLDQLPKDPLNSPPLNTTQQWRGDFNKIEQNITNSFCSSFHLLHKLQWFSKLRENIRNKFNTPK